jgi:hypothetical protein
MKSFAIVMVMVFFSAQTFAAPAKTSATDVKLTCVTTDFPTTSFVVETVGNEVLAHVIHHNGMKFMPIWSAIVVPNDIPMLSSKASELAKLGDRYTVRFARSSCQVTGEKMFNCFNGTEVHHNGIKLQATALHTEKVSHENIAGTYHRHWMHLSVNFDGKTHPFSMEYSPDDCFVD